MNLDKFLVLVCPFLVIAISIIVLLVWGALGDTNDKTPTNH